MKTMIRIMALLAVLMLAGCASTPPKSETTTGDESGMSSESGAETGSGAESEGMGTGAEMNTAANCPPDCTFSRDAIDDSSSLLSDRTIYFAFDSSNVKQEYMKVIQRHAAYLSQYSDVDVRVEGHTDERGSREYNVGLGSRRADSVSQLLQAYGVSQQQIKTVSYGEEQPAVEGHNEDAWSKNRRVELVYPANN